MKSMGVMKALLEKELRHNRGYLLAAGVLSLYVPVFKSLLILLRSPEAALQWGRQLDNMIQFYQAHAPGFSAENLHLAGVAAAILLGALLLGEERRGGLYFLVTTPVSRPDIIVSKFLVGWGTIMILAGINYLFLTLCADPLGLTSSQPQITRWALISGLAYAAIFSLVLFTSAFTSGVLAAAGLGWVLMYVPGMLLALAENVAARYFLASQEFSIQMINLSRYLTLPDYLNGEHWMWISQVHHTDSWRYYTVSYGSGLVPGQGTEILLLVLGSLVFLILAVATFARVSLDETGTVFASPRARKIAILVSGLIVANILVFPPCTTLGGFMLGWLVLTMMLLGAVEWRPRPGKAAEPIYHILSRQEPFP